MDNVDCSDPRTQGTPFTHEYLVIDNFDCTYDTSIILNVGPFPSFAGNDPTIANPQFTGTGSQQLIFTAYSIGNPSCGTLDTLNINIIQTPYAGADTNILIDSTIPAFDLFLLLGAGASTTDVWLNNQGDTITMPFDTQLLPPGNHI